MNVVADDEAIDHIAWVANGDIRVALNAGTRRFDHPRDADGTIRITPEIAADPIRARSPLRGRRVLRHALRLLQIPQGSDSDAAMYWFSRLIRR